tara:strand:- start:192 stop:1037 length:846 start_codon:yes stop_codon:yes gene_type:complete
MSSDRSSHNKVFSGQQSGIPTSNVMKDDFNYEVPVELVPLPSGGAVYPVGSPLHGQGTVEVRAMTAREEDILTSRALIKKGTVITHLIKSCMTNKDVEVHKMISGDRNALMVALRVTGYGQSYDVDVTCPACDVKSKQSFDLAELPIKQLGIEPVDVGQNLFRFELPMTKKTVQFKFLTGLDEQEIMTISERKKKSGFQGDNLVTMRLKFAIVSIEGITDKSKINSFIRNMPARDSLALRKYIDKNEPGIEMKSWMDCPACFEQSEVRLPMGAGFFWPDTE